MESREASIYQEMKKEILNLRELAKKVKAEGVKEGIEKVQALFSMLAGNRNERRALRQAPPNASKDHELTRKDVAAMLNETKDNIVGAIRGLFAEAPAAAGENKSTEAILEAIAEVKTGLGSQNSDPPWSEVVRRRKTANLAKVAPKTIQTSAKPTTRARPPAILVDVGREEFPVIAKKIRNGVAKDIIGDSVVGMRQTKSGGLLIEVRGDRVQYEAVKSEIARTAGEEVGVRSLQSRTLLEIKDMDEWTTREEVVSAMAANYKTNGEVFRLVSLRKQFGGAQAASVLVPTDVAKKIISEGRIKIGMVSCRVRPGDNKMRCFRCLSRGHMARTCAGPDRSDCCFRCGGIGHKVASCDATDEAVRTFAGRLEGSEQFPGSDGCAQPIAATPAQ